MATAEKIAVCLSCGNEWEVRTAGAKKRKCPLCGKYRVKMKGDLTPEDLQALKGGRKEENPEEKKEEEKTGPSFSPAEEAEDPADPPEEEGGRGGGLVFVALIVVAAGALWFLWGAYRNRRAEDYADEEVGYVRA